MAGNPFDDIPGAEQASASGNPFDSIPGVEGFDSATGAPVTKPAKPSLGQRAKQFAKEVPGNAAQLALFAAAANPGTAAVGIPALAASTTLKAVAGQGALHELDKIQNAVQPVDINTQTQKYFDALRPGLSAKGWTDDHIMQEARQRAINVAHGAQATKDSIDQDIQQTRGEINQLPGEMVTNAAFLAPAPKILGALGAGIAKAGAATAGKVGLEIAAKPVTSLAAKIGVSALKHAAVGGIVGGVGMGAGRATDRALEAWAADKPSHEIAQSLITGFKEGGKPGLVVGGLLGGAAGGLAKGAEVKVAQKAAAAQALARELVDKTAAQAAAQNAAIDATAASFNPHSAGIPAGVDPFNAATTVIQQAHGEDAALSEAGLRAASQIADRIKLYHDANEALEGNITPQEMGPSQGFLSGLQPVGAPTQAEGGLAPEPGLAPAVQGPLGSQFQQSQPPAQVTPAEGLEGAPAPSTAPPTPLSVTGSQLPQPEAGPFGGGPPPTLLNPGVLAGQGQFPESAPTQPVRPLEPNMRTLEPPPPPPAPKPSVEGMDLVHHAIDDAVNEGEHGKALKLAEKYGLPVDKKVARLAVNDLLNEGDHEGALKLAEKTGLRPTPEPKTKAGEKPKTEAKKETPKPAATKPEETKAATNGGAAPTETLKSPARDFGPLGVVEGSSHADAQEKAFAKFGQDTPAEQGTRGYTTESGKFVPAEEGDKIAEAAGQVREGAGKSPISKTYQSQDLLFPKSADPFSHLAETPARAMSAALVAETHAVIEPSADGKSATFQLGVKSGEVAKAGGPATALDKIVKAADEHGVRIETNLVPAPSNGGRIPLEKMIPFYKARGFKVVESTRIPEGNLATAKMVREPKRR